MVHLVQVVQVVKVVHVIELVRIVRLIRVLGWSKWSGWTVKSMVLWRKIKTAVLGYNWLYGAPMICTGLLWAGLYCAVLGRTRLYRLYCAVLG